MTLSKRRTESELLEKYRVALANAKKQPEIVSLMAEFGFTAEVIAVGDGIYAETRKAYDDNQTEDDETSVAYNNFSTAKNQLDEMYKLHRKKAKIIFRNDPITAAQLKITGARSKAYITWLEMVRKFYAVTSTDTTISAKFARLKVAPKEFKAANALIETVEASRSEYMIEKGESQDATQIKDKAFAKLDDWMQEFYMVAKIALEGKPQLLEVLGLKVKS